MKTIFIINPNAGQGKTVKKLLSEIHTAELGGADVDIYYTKSPGDAGRFAKDYCASNGAARFIACGGDGTVCEVVNGIIGFPGAQAGVLPLGTGNDFCRNFSDPKKFCDVPG